MVSDLPRIFIYPSLSPPPPLPSSRLLYSHSSGAFVNASCASTDARYMQRRKRILWPEGSSRLSNYLPSKKEEGEAKTYVIDPAFLAFFRLTVRVVHFLFHFFPSPFLLFSSPLSSPPFFLSFFLSFSPFFSFPLHVHRNRSQQYFRQKWLGSPVPWL